MRGHDQNGQMRVVAVQGLHQADAVHRLHAEIEKGQVKACAGNDRNGVLGILGRGHVEA